MDHGAGGDLGVADHAMRPDAHAVAQAHVALEHAADVDLDVHAARERAAQVEARRVGQAHAGVHLRVGVAALQPAFETRQLGRAVDAQHLGLVDRLGRADFDVVGHRVRDDVGQVVLALRVGVRQLGQPLLEPRGRRGHDAGVDLGDLALQRRRVLLFDDGPHQANAVGVAGLDVAHDAAVAERVGQIDGQQREVLAGAGRDQRAQRLGADQRHVAVEHQRDAVVGQHRHRLLHRVAGAELRHLAHEFALRAGERGFDGFRPVAGDDDALRWRQRLGGGEHVGQQRLPAERVQHLRARRPHPRAFARGHDHDAERHRKIPVHLKIRNDIGRPIRIAASARLRRARRGASAGGASGAGVARRHDALAAAAGGTAAYHRQATIVRSTTMSCGFSFEPGKSRIDASNIAANRRMLPSLDPSLAARVS